MLSACLIVKNEAAILSRALKSVKDWVEQIVVVDTGSVDNTIGIAESFGAIVSRFEWCDDFSAARNYAMGLVKTPWMLTLDADDIVMNPQRLPELCQIAHKNRVNGVWSLYDQDEGCHQRRLQLVKTKLYQWVGVVHESLMPKRDADGLTAVSDLWVKHFKPAERNEAAAKQYLKILLDKDPENYLGIAESYRFLGDLEKADFYYWQALNQNVNDDTKYMCAYQCAFLNLRMGDTDSERFDFAVRAAMYGVGLNQNRAECLCLLGLGYQAMREYKKALECFNRACESKPPADCTGPIYRQWYGLTPTRLRDKCLSIMQKVA